MSRAEGGEFGKNQNKLNTAMSMTQAQKDLGTLLFLNGIEKELIVTILTAFQDSEEETKEMLYYVIDNNPNETQLLEKLTEMAMRHLNPQDKMIYDEETGMYFENDFAMKNYKGAMACLKKQKPFTREEAIAQVQRLRQASERNAAACRQEQKSVKKERPAVTMSEESIREILEMSIEHIDLLAIRHMNVLIVNGIKTIGQLVKLTPDELLKIRGLKRLPIEELEAWLADKGLFLGMKNPRP